MMEHLVFPSVAANIDSLKNSVRWIIHCILPDILPYQLRARFIESPFSALWPENEGLLNEFRQFFRASAARRASARASTQNRGRGSNRGRPRQRTLGTLDSRSEVTEVEASVEVGMANRTPLESLPTTSNALQTLPATSPSSPAREQGLRKQQSSLVSQVRGCLAHWKAMSKSNFASRL